MSRASSPVRVRHGCPIAAGLLLFVLLTAGGCNEVGPEVLTGNTMGTSYHIKVADDARYLPRMQDDIEQELHTIDAQCSTWRDDSWLSAFNRSDALDWQTPPEHVWALLVRSRELAEQTDGCFDVTVGPLIDCWGYGRVSGPQGVPSDDALAAAMARVGWDKFELDRQQKRVRKLHPGASIDFSAIGKGYAVDRVAAVIERAGCMNYLIEIGGEVRAAGPGPEPTDGPVAGAGWTVAIQSPGIDSTARPARMLTLLNQSVATSGTAYQSDDAAGSSHLIDPRSGRSVAPAARSVTVIAGDAAAADAWATALMVLGEASGGGLAERHRLEVVWVRTSVEP